MSATANDPGDDLQPDHSRPGDRLAVLFDELAELAGQRNAIDGRIVDIVAEIDRDGIWLLHPGSLARPPSGPPPAVPPCPGPIGERADWWWYTPFQAQGPPANN